MGEELNTLPHANSAEAEGQDRKSLLHCPGVTHLNGQREKKWHILQLVCFPIPHSEVRK